ncbi:acetyl-CoA carboxylase biotin carboxyl carrier protein subunit, partial [Bacteroidales bacterium OttesenSCG-928-K03]|nr:acetyl-CoA carboxylase biotin carboxyl carrier protein subunit [Bacteroidales bacterium OttesenSCG-928-K03]
MAKKKTEEAKAEAMPEVKVEAKAKVETKTRKPIWRRNKSAKKDNVIEKNKEKENKKTKNDKKVEIPEANQHLDNLPLEGLTYKTHLTEKYLQRTKYNPHEPGTVYSKIPGTIKSIAVKVDQEVVEDEILCILDAMKMNNEILAPCAGTITEINVKPGQIIAKDVLLF